MHQVLGRPLKRPPPVQSADMRCHRLALATLHILLFSYDIKRYVHTLHKMPQPQAGWIGRHMAPCLPTTTQWPEILSVQFSISLTCSLREICPETLWPLMHARGEVPEVCQHVSAELLRNQSIFFCSNGPFQFVCAWPICNVRRGEGPTVCQHVPAKLTCPQNDRGRPTLELCISWRV